MKLSWCVGQADLYILLIISALFDLKCMRYRREKVKNQLFRHIWTGRVLVEFINANENVQKIGIQNTEKKINCQIIFSLQSYYNFCKHIIFESITIFIYLTLFDTCSHKKCNMSFIYSFIPFLLLTMRVIGSHIIFITTFEERNLLVLYVFRVTYIYN